MQPIPRREALRRLGLLVGGALSASTIAGLVAGCRAEPAGSTYSYRALTSDQQRLVGTLADIVIPETDTPGATAAGVPAFMDKLLADWMESEERTRFLAGLADVDARAQRAHNARFVDLNADQQTALVATLDAEAFPSEPPDEEESVDNSETAEAAAESGQSGTDAVAEEAGEDVGQADTTATEAPADPPPPFFSQFKELTIAGYYTSEVGATQELHWLAAPGHFDADAPLAEIGRTWA